MKFIFNKPVQVGSESNILIDYLTFPIEKKEDVKISLEVDGKKEDVNIKEIVKEK